MGDYSGWAINQSNKFNVKMTICRIVALGGFTADPGTKNLFQGKTSKFSPSDSKKFNTNILLSNK
jgi:hypothetical protein